MATAVEPTGTGSLEQASGLSSVAVRAGFVVLVFVCALVISGLLHLGGYAYPSFALAGSVVVHWHERGRVREMATAVLFGSGLFIAYLVLGGSFQAYVGCYIGTAAAFAGLGSLVLLSIRAAQTRGTEQRQLRGTLMRASLVPALCVVSMLAVCLGIKLAPRTWDYTLFAFDRLLGIDTFAIGRWFVRSRVFFNICAIVYNTLPLYLSATLIVMRLHGQWRAAKMMMLTLGAVGFLAYQICPAAGPVYRFPGLFPAAPVVGLVPIGPAELANAYRNAMPSLHMGFALLCYWNLRSVGRWLGIAAAAQLILTGIATLGCGEHYFIDLVVSVPLALAVYSAWSSAAGSNLNLTVTTIAAWVSSLWLLALRTGMMLSSRAVGWTAVLITVVAGFTMQRMLQLGSQDREFDNLAAQEKRFELTDSRC